MTVSRFIAGLATLNFTALKLALRNPHLARAYVSRCIREYNELQLIARYSGPKLRPASPAPAPAPGSIGEYILSWATDPASRQYVDTHLQRLEKTLAITPPGQAADPILDMGAYFHITPALHTYLGYGEVRACYYGPPDAIERKCVRSTTGQVFECCVDLFDAERDSFPYANESFTTVLCCELLEHLAHDPMHMMAEINRILRPEGCIVLTTPNLSSLRAIASLLRGYNHPGLFPAFIPPGTAGRTEARHSREYTPEEIYHLLQDSGFEVISELLTYPPRN
jgi:SAM-dependent methyltransferase